MSTKQLLRRMALAARPVGLLTAVLLGTAACGSGSSPSTEGAGDTESSPSTEGAGDTESSPSTEGAGGAGSSPSTEGAGGTGSSPSTDGGAVIATDGGVSKPDGSVPPTTADAGGTTGTGTDALRGYWVWEKRVEGTAVQSGPVDKGQMKLAFGTGNNKCHYIWNETTGSDFHTECTYTLKGDLVTLSAKADPDKTAAGWSCAHPSWTAWNDRPAIQYARYKFVGDRLWIGVNSYWGGVNGGTASCKRFPFWESEAQATTVESWIVYKPVTRQEWYTKYAISTNCQGTPAECAQWPGCGAGDKAYVD